VLEVGDDTDAVFVFFYAEALETLFLFQDLAPYLFDHALLFGLALDRPVLFEADGLGPVDLSLEVSLLVLNVSVHFVVALGESEIAHFSWLFASHYYYCY
jgi:hypothetical protein